MKSTLMRVSKEQFARDEAEQSAAKISAEFHANKDEKKAREKANPQIGAHSELRRKILSLSLFPNVVSVKPSRD